jgi:cytochrome c oxidase assembly protein subunit 17
MFSLWRAQFVASASVPAAPAAPATAPVAGEEQPKKKKMCCACPDTKKARDECVQRNGEAQCGSLIEAHKACLRKEGFDV